MKRRLLLSVALVAALYGFWVVLAKPTCQVGFAASLGKDFKWTCVVQ
ncbi:MAG: hypothetical protein ACRD9W_07965 [Terriglobia bacterium]